MGKCYINMSNNVLGRMNEDRVVLGGMDRNLDRLLPIKHLVISGCGTSKYAALYGEKLMKELRSFETCQV